MTLRIFDKLFDMYETWQTEEVSRVHQRRGFFKSQTRLMES
jgi:hypothetical protein